MYRAVWERVVRQAPPFHQKVLRCNYDIPLPLLRLVLETVFARLEASEVCVADDSFERGGEPLESCRRIAAEAVLRLAAAQVGGGMVKLGVFDEGLQFYLRVHAEDELEVSAGQERCGSFELFAEDAVLTPLFKELSRQISAHLLLEGAKRYLDEIADG